MVDGAEGIVAAGVSVAAAASSSPASAFGAFFLMNPICDR